MKPKYTQAMLMKADLLTLAKTVLDATEDARERLNCAEALYARLPELNGGNWLLMGQKKGFSEDETRMIRDAMDFQSTIMRNIEPPTPPRAA